MMKLKEAGEKLEYGCIKNVDPVQEFHETVVSLRSQRTPFVIATVIEVIGSASAKTGSKAIFSQEGQNLLGWVGGGCAERFIGEESKAALEEKRTRVILADLDDEIFGLGVACGGKMRVFIEPFHPSETITLAPSAKFTDVIRILSGFYGWNVFIDPTLPEVETPEELLVQMASSVAGLRHRSMESMRLIKVVPAKFLTSKKAVSKNVTIVGRTRITEALARHFSLLNYNIRAIGPGLRKEDYPSHVQCYCLDDGYASIEFGPNEVVVIAGHTSLDPLLVEKALKAGASHVAMIGSYKRSVEVLTHLGLLNQEITAPLYVPAGLDIDARNPDEIALSVMAEVILEGKK